jgi:hypothetical protein
LGLIVGVAAVGRSDTVKLNEVDRDIAPSDPVTTIGNVPAGVEALMASVNTVEHVGLQEVVAKEAFAPLGSPETA